MFHGLKGAAYDSPGQAREASAALGYAPEKRQALKGRNKRCVRTTDLMPQNGDRKSKIEESEI
jgi:hypothetical protein